jgi:hypothetical protein
MRTFESTKANWVDICQIEAYDHGSRVTLNAFPDGGKGEKQ